MTCRHTSVDSVTARRAVAACSLALMACGEPKDAASSSGVAALAPVAAATSGPPALSSVPMAPGPTNDRAALHTETTQKSSGPRPSDDSAQAPAHADLASRVALVAPVTTAPVTTTARPVGKAPTSGRQGIYINGDLVAGKCTRAKCVPLCRDPATKPNDKAPDWGWENNESCVLAGSTTALVAGGDRALAVQNHGYAVPPRACVVGAKRVDPFRPPQLDAKRRKHASFTTSGSQIIDAYGEPFVPRAVNNASAWYDTCAQYSGFEALDNIAATGANSVRLGWAFDSIDPGGPTEGDPERRVIGTTPDLLAESLYRSIELGLVPIVTFNDSTGQVDGAWADKMAKKITSPKYLRVFKAYEPFILLGIANELNVPFEQYADAYGAAIRKIRATGYKGTLVVTANEWGQGCDSLLTFGPLLVAMDPAHNLVFDLHVYTYVHYHNAAAPNRFAGGEPERVAGCLDEVARLELPLLVGEFGQNHSSGPVAWETIIERTNANGQGYAPWLWYGDTEYPQLNMSLSWEGPLTDWGQKATADFAVTSRKASIFR